MTATHDKTTDPFQAFSVGVEKIIARELAGLPVPIAWTDRLSELEREAVALSRPAFAPRIAIGNRKRGDSGTLVDRTTPLGNPYRIGEHGTRAEVIARYGVWLDTQLANPDSPQTRMMMELRHAAIYGPVTLLCHCAPEACHAEVIRARLYERMGHVGTAVREPAGERQPELFAAGKRQWGI